MERSKNIWKIKDTVKITGKSHTKIRYITIINKLKRYQLDTLYTQKPPKNLLYHKRIPNQRSSNRFLINVVVVIVEECLSSGSVESRFRGKGLHTYS